MSDALACWFFRSIECGAGKQSVPGLLGLVAQGEFEEFVDYQRRFRDGKKANLKDDDVTFVRIHMGDSLPARAVDLMDVSF